MIPHAAAKMILRTFGGVAVCLIASQTSAADSMVDFNFEVRPLLSDRCYRCHGPDAGSRKGKLRLDTRDGALKKLEDGWAVVKPGDPDKSELIRRLFTDNEDDLMPPADSHLTLTAAEKDLLKRWIAEGAEFKPHWAFLPVQSFVPPLLKKIAPDANPIDAFVLARLEKENLSPAKPASRETLLRRLALNLTGLPPTPAEIDAFTADKSADAYDKVVARYLSSPAYGERMALDWLDLARYADTYGYQNDVERDMSAWRDWVIKAFNENLPYDKFLIWQLAGDLLPNATREQRLATAFNRLHRQTNEGGSIDEEFRTEYAADRVNTVGTAMLGLTMECARCHDHKFDPIRQRDYFSLFAFFNSIDESGMYSHFTSATPTPAMPLWPPAREKQHIELKTRIARAESQLEKVARSAKGEFARWAKTAEIQLPPPLAHFTFDNVTNKTTPDLLSTNVAKLEDDPTPVAGALQFSGDNQVVCKSVKPFLRTDPFSFSLRLKPAESQERAIILHQSKAWWDAGSRGFELTLDHGKPCFGLIHFWPGNAAVVRAKQALPLNEWSQLTVTYDGSSHATGIRLYRNGAPLETEIVRNSLTKDISYSETWTNRYAKQPPLTLAARFRDSGFKNGLLDDLRVFDVCLTPTEARLLATDATTNPANPKLDGANKTARTSKSVDPSTFDYFLARHDEPYQAALAELKQLREAENKLIYEVPEIMIMAELPQPRVTHLLKRGAYDTPGEVVPRETPDWLLPFPKGQPRNRLGLANWMVDRKNPLTARVVVNRIWRIHFGRGIVASPEDFGLQGKLPSHPELLDWLADWFMENEWDVKASTNSS
jgi:hypothetical protein